MSKKQGDKPLPDEIVDKGAARDNSWAAALNDPRAHGFHSVAAVKHAMRQIAEEDEAERLRWTDAVKSPTTYGFHSVAEAEHAARLHMGQPSAAEAAELNDAFPIWEKLGEEQAHLEQVESQRPLAPEALQAQLATLPHLRERVKDLRDGLQDLNAWPLDGKPNKESAASPVDHSMLATPDELTRAFGRYTGMEASWFRRLADKPGLSAARKVLGAGQRGRRRQPLFCPMEVMLWLLSEKRRCGRRFSNPDTAWQLLEKNFPRVYAQRSAADPRVDPAG